MAGSTTRLALYKPGGGSTGLYLPDEVADIDKLNDNFNLIDEAVGAKNVTSTTRPAVPFDGQIIKESDTGRAMSWRPSISEWVELTPGSYKGSTALRDLLFPTPGTAAGRVALANASPTFLNTDVNFGFEQRYFAPTADSAEPEYRAQNARGGGGWMPSTPFERGAVVRGTATSTVPTAFGDIPDMALTVIASGGKMRLTAHLPWGNPVSGADRVVAVRALLDDVAIPQNPNQIIIPFFPAATVNTHTTHVWDFTPAAGSRVVKLQATASVLSSVSSAVNAFMKLEEVAG